MNCNNLVSCRQTTSFQQHKILQVHSFYIIMFMGIVRSFVLLVFSFQVSDASRALQSFSLYFFVHNSFRRTQLRVLNAFHEDMPIVLPELRTPCNLSNSGLMELALQSDLVHTPFTRSFRHLGIERF